MATILAILIRRTKGEREREREREREDHFHSSYGSLGEVEIAAAILAFLPHGDEKMKSKERWRPLLAMVFHNDQNYQLTGR